MFLVFKKTIYPAHTITLLLPAEQRVLFCGSFGDSTWGVVGGFYKEREIKGDYIEMVESGDKFS